MAPPNARMMTSWIFMARSRAAAASTIVTSLIDDGCSATPGKSGHFTCSRERTDHVKCPTPGKSGHFTCSRERTDHVLPTLYQEANCAHRQTVVASAPLFDEGGATCD